MDNIEVMRIGDFKATGNIFKIFIMELIIGFIVWMICLLYVLTFKPDSIFVLYFMRYGLYCFFEIGITASCLSYVRDETDGVKLSDIFYPLISTPIRFIIISLLNVIVFPIFLLIALFFVSIGLDFLIPIISILAIFAAIAYKYFFFIIPYIAIDYPDESLIDIIKTGIFFERKPDFVFILFFKLTFPIVWGTIMVLWGIFPDIFSIIDGLYDLIRIIGGLITFILSVINVPRVYMSFAVLYDDVIKTYYEDGDYDDSYVNPYVAEYEESFHEYGDFNSDDFLD